MKLAKCGKYSLSFCNTKFRECKDCRTCILVKHNIEPRYKFVNGYKLKKCPHCGEYKQLDEFKCSSTGHRSWCYDCHKIYSREYASTNHKIFMVGYKEDNKKKFIQFDTSTKMIKFIRQYIDNNINAYIEIKRIK